MDNRNFVCNMCLGELKKVTDTLFICVSCGKNHLISTQTEEEIIWLSNANKTLRIGNFDDAYQEFSSIISKYPKCYEAYFGMVLSKHGIIYVDDIVEGKKVPTCYNITNNSIFNDENYKLTVKYAPKNLIENYEKLANQIESIRKEWLDKASKEKPYDVFISFKQSDKENNIEKTKDYYTCLELYHHLTYKCGLKVFFSPETLKNKLSERYEPYIYNAINTAKVMILYGQKAEYINSTWVKNEWIRYLKKIKDKEKEENSLVVCYENFDAYNLPNELKNFQALNASNKDFLDTLVNHIKKVLNKYEDSIKIQRKVVIPNPIKPINNQIGNKISKSRELGVNFVESKNDNIEKIILSSNKLLLNGDFENAKNLIEKVLEVEPKNSDALFIKFLITHNLSSMADLKEKLISGQIIHKYVLIQLVENIRKEKALELLNIIKEVIIKILLSHDLGKKENNILTLYQFITQYDFEDKVNLNYTILNVVSARYDTLQLFSYAIKLLGNNQIEKYISYHEKLYDFISMCNIEIESNSNFNSEYIEKAFNVVIKNKMSLRKFLLDKILQVDNTNKNAIFNMYNITCDNKYLERDLSNTKNNSYLIDRLSVYLKYYQNLNTLHFEEVIQYIPENEDKLYISYVKNRYNAIKNFLLIKKEERLFKTIIKYIEILRKYDVDSNQYRFETLIYNQNCVNENDLIQNGIVLNKLPNYLDLFISFDEEYQNKILEIIKKQEKYHLDQKELERIKIEKEEREEEVKKKKFSEIQEAQKINNDRKRKEKVGFVISIIAFILYIVLLIIFNIIQFDDLTGFGIVGSIINFIVQFVYLSFYSTSENDGHSVISVLNVITILFVIISLGVACDNCF